MIPTAELLTYHETCPRKAFWSDWSAKRLSPTEMVRLALDVALRSPERKDEAPGELAGSEIMALAEDRGLELPDGVPIYPSVIHHACLADLLVSAIRKPGEKPWLVPENVQIWTPSCYLSPDGRYLRRIVLASHWSDERHYSECRSWYAMGEIAHYQLPMQMVVLVIGNMVHGLRRGSPWTSGFLHPSGNGQLRFRKKTRATSEVFKETWIKILREDHAEISRESWLEAMLRDDVLQEVCFKVDIPVPSKEHVKHILEIAKKAVDRIQQIREVPDPQLSSCDWPVPCIFRRCCHACPEKSPSEANGFVMLR